MTSTPKSMRLHIGIFGRTNVGKSSLMNLIAAQDVALTSPIAGTTTDVVEKPIELLPIGPVNLMDTAGLDDVTELGLDRRERTRRALERTEAAILVAEPNVWTEHEQNVVDELKKKSIPFIVIINKVDMLEPNAEFLEFLATQTPNFMGLSSADTSKYNEYLIEIKSLLRRVLPAEMFRPLPLISDLLPEKDGLVVMIIPIDSQAPKGRIILPQVQTLRDALDNGVVSVVTRETEFLQSLAMLARKPDLVICDSQVVHKMVAETPPTVPCTTFSILFSRFKGDIVEEARGAAAISKLRAGDKILIAEACSHHPLEDDIGRIKIPRWLRGYLDEEIQIDHVNGRDYPANISEYKLVIHCGSCMLTRFEKLARIEKAAQAGVPITNYGLTISYIQGVLERVLTPFPAALKAHREALNNG
ncbi:MAG: [FeFe] hydrogenase H-cluster maturation GTPase HydF [Chloroflexota bacterium]